MNYDAEIDIKPKVGDFAAFRLRGEWNYSACKVIESHGDMGRYNAKVMCCNDGLQQIMTFCYSLSPAFKLDAHFTQSLKELKEAIADCECTSSSGGD